MSLNKINSNKITYAKTVSKPVVKTKIATVESKTVTKEALTATSTTPAQAKTGFAVPKLFIPELPPVVIPGWIALLFMLALIVGLIIYVKVKFFRKEVEKIAPQKTKTLEEELPKNIKDLKEALVKEMRGTSRQNWIMIVLTIVFILVSISGGAIFIIFQKIPSLLPNLIHLLKH